MSNTNLKFQNGDLEKMILSNCMYNSAYFIKFGKYLKTEDSEKKSYFVDKKKQFIFNLFYAYFNYYKKPPTKKLIKLLIDKKVKEQDKKEIIFELTDEIFANKLEEVEQEYLERETISFIKENRVYEAIMASQEKIDKKQYSDIVGLFEEAVRVTFDKDFGVSVRQVSEVIDYINVINNENVISTGYSNLNDILGGGFKGSSLYVFSALPGGNKSNFMGNLAVNAMNEGKKVLYITFEMNKYKLLLRLLQKLSKTSRQEIIESLEETESKKFIEEFIQNIEESIVSEEGDLIVKEYPSNGADANDVLGFLKDLKMYKNWEPDIIFFDYILIMKSTLENQNANSYDYYKRVSEDIRNIGKTIKYENGGIPIVSAVQINREGMADGGGSKANVSSKQMSGSRGVLDTADYFGILGATKLDKKEKTFMLITDKNRDGSTDTRIKYKVNYSLMDIKEESIYT